MAPNRLLAWGTQNSATQTDIADLAGLSPSYINRIAQGYDPPPHVKLAIARALRTRVRDLFPAETHEAATG